MPQQFANNTVGNRFIELQSIDSTNNYALGQVHAGMATHGTVYFAHEQTAGKGQRGRSWSAEKDAGLAISAVLDPQPLLTHQQFYLSMAVALAARDFFKNYAGTDTKIKWPNDLYWKDRKAGGILIESILGTGATRQWHWAIAGIGININQGRFPPELPNPVSLKQITGKTYNIWALARELCDFLENRVKELKTGSLDKLLADYNEHLYKKGEVLKFRKESRVFEGRVNQVLPNGNLELLTPFPEVFSFGEIIFLPHSTHRTQ